ncbi:MAG TPA: DUF1549 domain-containing protein, partial [Armatimonadota bacterium]|nr:DUF1549 domain-containing protein [Armatimonadota bacterium]
MRSSWWTARLLAGGLASVLFATCWAAAQTTGPQATPARRKATPPEAAEAFFETRVRPILVAKCYACHSAKGGRVQGGLKLDSREGLLAGGARGPALVPGDPEHSSLIRAVTFHDADLKMPPGGKLKDVEVAALTAWVKIGAPWPGERMKAEVRRKKGGGALLRTPQTSPGKPWPYSPPTVPSLPVVKNRSWGRSPIDRLILSALEAKGLSPAPPADRRTLIRRATFDLIGLPPTPSEIRDFLADTEPGAFARVVDRLLASPAYGERWGRHWLDVARYADSNGLDENLVFPNAWRYRDYVIRAFNADKPIDRFIQEQIAGDLLPAAVDETADLDRTIATGFLSLGPKMLAEDDPMKQEEDIVDEQVDTLGKAFLGLTLGCARCHDHKFDPISQSDYYALAVILKSTKTMVNFKVVAEWQEVPLASRAEREKLASLERAVQAKKEELERARKNAGDAVLAEAQRNASRYVLAAQELLKDTGPRVVLQPAITAPDAPLPPHALLVEAEDFVHGNVLKDREHYGAGIGVLVNAGPMPNLAEYELSVPEAGPYQLDLRFASADARSLRIYINDLLVHSAGAASSTGGFFPDAQRWSAEGVFPLHAGKNRIRLEREGPFPHIDKLLLTPRPGLSYGRTTEQAAAEAGL